MRASMPMNLERSEFPKGERAKLKSPSGACAPASVESRLYFAVFASFYFQRHFAVVPSSSSVPSRSSSVLLNKRAPAVLARLSSRLRSWKCCSPRPSLFSAAFRPKSFGSETGFSDLGAKKDGERVHRLPSCVMVKILELCMIL